jgi:non-heme Fe2+,alpha-ketoglutarate-dependent halogenase
MEDDESMVSVWLAMSPVTKANGCMRMVAHKHTETGFMDHAEGEAAVEHAGGKLEDNMSSKGQCIVGAADLEEQAEHIELKPGDIAIFHLKTPHASAANVADYPRIGMAMRYMRTDCKKINAAVDGGARDSATLVSGKDVHKYWDEEFVPKEELSPDALAAHEKAMGGAGGGGHKRRIVPAGR